MQKNKALFFAVVLVLTMNIVLLIRIGDLNNRIETISQNYNYLQSSLNSISGNINQTLDRFTREQSWITPVEINNERSNVEKEQGQAVLNWQIKDFQEGAEVIFHYRQSESGEFKAIPAKNQNTGFFEVQIPLEMKAEPSWDIQTTRSRENGISSEQAVEVRKPADQSLRCYVSMKTKDSIKSSEISYISFDHLANMKYRPINGHVEINRNNYSISLFQDSNSYNRIESLTVEFYNGSNLVDQKPMEVQNAQNGIQHYFLTYDSGSKSFSHITFRVKYNDGSTFGKEISI